MDIIDAQVHVTPVGCTGILAVMEAFGISATILDEFWGYDDQTRAKPFASLENGASRPLSPHAQAAALLHPERFAWVQRVDRRDTELRALFAILGGSPGCIGVRIDLRANGELQQLADGGWDDLLILAGERQFPVSVLSRQGITAIKRTAERLPDVRFLVDHCGHAGSDEEWRDILALGSQCNVWLKWAQAHLVFKDANFPFPKVQARLRQAVDSFGPHHVVWASNATVTGATATMWELLQSALVANDLSSDDRDWLVGRSARHLYQWKQS